VRLANGLPLSVRSPRGRPWLRNNPEPLAKLCRADARISDGRCTQRWDRGDLTRFQ
jgi:hypothetical protein